MAHREEDWDRQSHAGEESFWSVETCLVHDGNDAKRRDSDFKQELEDRTRCQRMHPGIVSFTVLKRSSYYFLNLFILCSDSFLTGPPTGIRHTGSDGGLLGSWDWMWCLSLSTRSIVHCSKALLFQHLTNTVCRPTMHMHAFTVTQFLPLVFSIRYLDVSVASALNATQWEGSGAANVRCAVVWSALLLLPGTSRCQWCWWVTRWTWRTRGRCPPARARRWLRTGAAPSWRRRPRARPWWMSFLQRSWGRWISALCRTGERPAALPAAYSSSQPVAGLRVRRAEINSC